MTFADIQETLHILGDWEDRYAFLIELGGKLAPYPADKMNAAHAVPGCIASVWMDYNWQDGTLNMQLMSDAAIVKGLLYILISLYEGQTAAQILDIDAKAAFASLGLEDKMTANRRDGFVAVSNRIKALASAQI